MAGHSSCQGRALGAVKGKRGPAGEAGGQWLRVSLAWRSRGPRARPPATSRAPRAGYRGRWAPLRLEQRTHGVAVGCRRPHLAGRAGAPGSVAQFGMMLRVGGLSKQANALKIHERDAPLFERLTWLTTATAPVALPAWADGRSAARPAPLRLKGERIDWRLPPGSHARPGAGSEMSPAISHEFSHQ
jgi:hypothetical protein